MRQCGGNGPQKAFRFTLNRRRRVQFWTYGGHDTVLHIRRSNDCSQPENLYCDDDAGHGVNSYIGATLDAGTYYLIVDGYYGSAGVTQVQYIIL